MATKKYLKSLRVGDKVRFGKMYREPLAWIIAEKEHNGYPSNSVTLTTEKYVATLAFDGAEPYAENDDMKWYGRGRYKVSNISQWLQSTASAGNWYSAQHIVDHSPSRGYVDYDHYENFAGFLNEFDPQEVDMLIETTRSVPTCPYFGVGSKEFVTAKMFLLTDEELGWATLTKDIVQWYRTASNRVCRLSADAVAHAQSLGGRNLSEDEAYPMLTASSYPSDRDSVYHLNTSGKLVQKYAYCSAGIRPACNLSGDTLITSEPDEDGYYTVVVNYAPTEPAPIRVEYEDEALGSNTVRSGKPITVSWARSTDPDNNFDHYELERKYGDGDFVQVYSGTNRTFSDVAKYGEASVTYRVRAVDYYDLTSEYVATQTLNIWSNEPPVVTIDEDDLGTFGMTGPTLTYKLRDPDASTVTLTITMDGKTYREHAVTATADDAERTFQFTEREWLKVQNGQHTLRVAVSDTHNETDSATATFTKAVEKIVFRRMKPVEATEAPTEIIVRVNGEYPEEGITVEACNNANDAEPTWEDMTEDFLDDGIYTFTNTTKTDDTWAVDFRVTIERGTFVGDIFVDSVTSNFLAGESSTSGRTRGGVQYVTEPNDAGGETLKITG